MDVYFDNAASTIITKEVLDEMIKCQKDIFANPSSVHKFGRKAKTIIENCRSIISSKLKTSPGNIFLLPVVLREIIWPYLVLQEAKK